MRVGIGWETRPLQEGRPLVLGGVEVPGGAGLVGEPDGDALTAAVIDALLGAAGLGGTGEALPGPPPGEGGEAGPGRSSLALLEESVALLERENYQVVNVDLTVLSEGPRLGPYVARMAAALSERLHAGPASVSIKPREWRVRPSAQPAVGVIAVALIDQIGDIDALHATIRSGG